MSRYANRYRGYKRLRTRDKEVPNVEGGIGPQYIAEAEYTHLRKYYKENNFSYLKLREYIKERSGSRSNEFAKQIQEAITASFDKQIP